MIPFLQLREASPWRKDALCATLADPDDMFPTPGDVDGQIAAKTVCVMCPARPACLDWALATDQQYGVLGGLTEKERADLDGRRPPTHPEMQDNTRTTRPSRPQRGTEAGWKAHKDRHEKVCSPCAAARAPAAPTAPPDRRLPIDHGTYPGACQHRRRGEPLCDDCRVADNNYQQERRAARREQVAA